MHSFQRPIRFLPETDYPRAFVSFPRIAGSGNEIVDDAIEGIKRFGPGCFLAKTDIESAFRLVPVHPDDYELLGMCWEGEYYYDKVLPFGLRSAPSIFNKLSDALEWILLNKCKISFVCHILDDFLLIEPPAAMPPFDSTCQQSLTDMLSTFETINIPIAQGKTQGPSQQGSNFIAAVAAIAVEGEQNAVDHCVNFYTIHFALLLRYLNLDVDQIMRKSLF